MSVNSIAPLHFSNSHKTVLVTGGTGFVGRLLVNALLADGQHVTLLTRNISKANKMFGGRVTCVDDLQALPTNHPIDVVINLAGARILGWRWTQARKSVLRDSRIGLTQKLIDWIARADHKPELFLSASAIGYYGIQKIGDDTELNEESPSQSIFMSSLCRDWEASAHAATQFGVQVVSMRFGLVLGHGGALPMMLLPIKLGMGGALGSGKQWMSWIHVEDLLRAIAHIWQLAESPTTKLTVKPVYNFTAPQTISQLEFSKTAAKILHRPCCIPTPAWPMRLVMGEQADLLLEGQRVVPTNLISSGFAFNYCRIDDALQNLCK